MVSVNLQKSNCQKNSSYLHTLISIHSSTGTLRSSSFINLLIPEARTVFGQTSFHFFCRKEVESPTKDTQTEVVYPVCIAEEAGEVTGLGHFTCMFNGLNVIMKCKCTGFFVLLQAQIVSNDLQKGLKESLT